MAGRGGTRRTMAALALGWAALPLFTSSAAAEATWLPPPIEVVSLQPIDFQYVWAGVNATVSRTDPLRAGILAIKGTGNNEIIMTFQLPSMLQGPGGALMPIVFGANDAGYADQNNPGQAVGFNPHSPHINKLHGAKGYVFLGGTVSPQLGQAAGAYQAPITMTVAYTGN